TLPVLLRLRRIVEREFDIVKSLHVCVVQRFDRIAVRGDREFDRLGAQILHKRAKLGMHAVLAGAEIDRTHRQAAHHRADLPDGQAIDARRVAITERARQIAFVGEPEAERKSARLTGDVSMPNPFSDFWDFLIGNTEDHNALGAWKYLFVALFLALIVASIVIAIRNWREDPAQRTGSNLGTWFVRVLVGGMWFQ